MWVAIAGVASIGCTEKGHQLSAEEKAQVEAHVSEEAPDVDQQVRADFEGKIELLGYSVEPEVWKEGEELQVTWYWKANESLEDDWKLFTHVADAKGTDRLNFDSAGVIRQLYPPGRWEEGQHIRDVQKVVLPKDWNSPRATFYVGVWNGPHRLRVKEGPNDGDNRVRAFNIRTEEASEPAEDEGDADLPSLTARKAKEAPTIDGKLDDAAWKDAIAGRPFVDTMKGTPAEPRSTVQLAWDDEHLYAAFRVQDDLLKSDFTEHDEHLWEQDAVEIMVDPDGDGRNYFEMQVSPAGVVFDTRYDTRRQPKPFGHVDWSSELEAKVEVRGEIGDDEADEGYSAEIAIPWKAFAAGSPPASPPSVGDTWRMNFFVMDAREEGQRAVGWSPPETGDFHVPARFGRVRFVDAEGRASAEQMRPEVMEKLRERLKKARQQGPEGRKPSPASAEPKR
ncbi:MAG: carbohydrate-binding family 9-like protein [Myxococcota bacterium]